MPYFSSSFDGARLFYADYVPSSSSSTPAFRPTQDPSKDLRNKTDVALVFIHGWPMSHRMYEHLLLRLSETHGVRCIASDRRGFGKSEWRGEGTKDITYDTFAQDTCDLLQTLKLTKFFFVGASMGCGESLLAYLNASDQVKKSCGGFVWLGSSLPYPLSTPSNPSAPSRELWDMILDGFRADRTGFTRASVPGVFGIPFGIGIELPQTVLDRFERIVEEADAMALERCVQIISHRDFTNDLKKLDGQDVKILVVHGDSDQSMPSSASADLIPKLATQAKVKIYEKAAHGLYLTHADHVIDDILAVVFG